MTNVAVLPLLPLYQLLTPVLTFLSLSSSVWMCSPWPHRLHSEAQGQGCRISLRVFVRSPPPLQYCWFYCFLFFYADASHMLLLRVCLCLIVAQQQVREWVYMLIIKGITEMCLRCDCISLVIWNRGCKTEAKTGHRAGSRLSSALTI